MIIGRVIGVIATCALMCSMAAGQSSNRNKADEATVEKYIIDTVRQMYEAEKRKDLNFVLAHLADDFAEVAGDGGVYHRADIMAGWSDVVLKDYRLSECVFKLMTSDSAYMSCKMEVDATYKGQPFPKLFRVTTVWTRQGQDWIARFEQGTIIPQPSTAK